MDSDQIPHINAVDGYYDVKIAATTVYEPHVWIDGPDRYEVREPEPGLFITYCNEMPLFRYDVQDTIIID